SELGQAVGLDLALGVQAELAFHADLDPQALAVESVLVPLVEPAESPVPLEDVLQGPAPRGVDGQDLVRGHRTIDEAPLRALTVELAKPLEGLVPSPPFQDLQLECGMVRL